MRKDEKNPIQIAFHPVWPQLNETKVLVAEQCRGRDHRLLVGIDFRLEQIRKVAFIGIL